MTSFSSSLAYGPYSLTSASFRNIAYTDLSSAFFLHLLPPIYFRSFSVWSNHLNFGIKPLHESLISALNWGELHCPVDLTRGKCAWYNGINAECPKGGVDCGEEEISASTANRSQTARPYNPEPGHCTYWVIPAPDCRVVTR
jgi:hypothetical protein